MARPRNFDDSEILEKAMRTFWVKGYENTSLKDLLEAMGILNGSFYNSFKNKKALYIETMARYSQEFEEQFDKLFRSPWPVSKRLYVFLTYSIERYKSGQVPKGCYIFNAVTSEAVADPDLFRFIAQTRDNFESILTKQLRQAQQQGEISKDLQVGTVAACIVTFFQGLMNASVSGVPEESLKAQIRLFIDGLRL